MRNTFRSFLTVIAVIGLVSLSFTACDDSPTTETVPGAVTNFAATPGNGQVFLSWSAPSNDGGAVITHYEVSSNNGTSWGNATSDTGHTFTGLTNGTQYTFRVRAINSIGAGVQSTATATPSESSNLTLSLNGIWGTSWGEIVTISGNTGVTTQFGTVGPLTQDAINKSYLTIGGQAFRYLNNTSGLTWTGQMNGINYNNSAPNVATASSFRDCTITMSANGQSFTVNVPSVNYTVTYTRTTYSLNGVWETSWGEVVTISGNTGVTTHFGTVGPLTQDAISKNYLTIGGQAFKNLNNTSGLTWTGEMNGINYNNSAPNVAIGSSFRDCTITMSANGQSFTANVPSVNYTVTYTRRQ